MSFYIFATYFLTEFLTLYSSKEPPPSDSSLKYLCRLFVYPKSATYRPNSTVRCPCLNLPNDVTHTSLSERFMKQCTPRTSMKWIQINDSPLTRLWAGWQRNMVSISVKAKRFFLFSTGSKPAFGPTQHPIRWVPRDLSPWVKQMRREANHSPPSCLGVKNGWSYKSTHPYACVACCIIKYRENFTFIEDYSWTRKVIPWSLVASIPRRTG
jgi:hypothetical protein